MTASENNACLSETTSLKRRIKKHHMDVVCCFNKVHCERYHYPGGRVRFRRFQWPSALIKTVEECRK